MTEIQGETVELKGSLNDAQAARAEALKIARAALCASGVWSVGTLPAGRSVGDLTYLAEWVLEGSDNDDERDPVAYGEGHRVGYVNGMSEAAMIAHDVSPEAEKAILNRLNEPKHRHDPDGPQCSDTAKDWHCPPFEDIKLDIVASSTPPVPGARKVGGCWVPPADQYDLPAEQYREAMEAESTTDDSQLSFDDEEPTK